MEERGRSLSIENMTSCSIDSYEVDLSRFSQTRVTTDSEESGAFQHIQESIIAKKKDRLFIACGLLADNGTSLLATLAFLLRSHLAFQQCKDVNFKQALRSKPLRSRQLIAARRILFFDYRIVGGWMDCCRLLPRHRRLR